jgi:hypothetical protein
MPFFAGEQAIKESMVQFRDAQNNVRGCGLLVDSQHVATCAHVVASVIPDVKPHQVHKPTAAARVVFPHFKHTAGLRAKVIVWKPVTETPPLDFIEDIAILKLNKPAPIGAVPHGLLLASNWAGRGYMAYGFPESNPLARIIHQPKN